MKFQSLLGNKGYQTVTHQMLKFSDRGRKENFEYIASQTYSSGKYQYPLVSKLEEIFSKRANRDP